MEEPLFRPEPDRSVRAAADVVDTGRDAVADGCAERDDPVQRRVVAEGAVVTAHPKAPGLVEVQGADPAIVLVYLPGNRFPGLRVDDGKAGAHGTHV